jgi:hypothetical protein
MEVKLNKEIDYLDRVDTGNKVFNDVSFRLDLTADEMTAMINLFIKLAQMPNSKVSREVKYLIGNKQILQNTKRIVATRGKKEAAKKAAESRREKAREKIQNAINMLRLEGKPITAYSISKVSGVQGTNA